MKKMLSRPVRKLLLTSFLYEFIKLCLIKFQKPKKGKNHPFERVCGIYQNLDDFVSILDKCRVI